MHFRLHTGPTAPYSVLPPEGKEQAKPLYVESPRNALLNDFGIYVMDQLCTFQCMGALRIKENNDIATFIDSMYPEIVTPGRATVNMHYVWSKELIAYVETLMFAAPFYKQDDDRMADIHDTQYEYNLTRYTAVTYDQLHLIMTTKLCAWLKRFPHTDDIDYCEKAVRVAGAHGTKTTSEDHVLDVDSEVEE